MCGPGADETPHGLRVFEGRWADGYLGRHPVRPGYAYVIWKGRHVAEPTELSAEEAAGFWSDVARVAGAVDEEYRPAKMNWFSLGNGVPHLHVHLVPRPFDDARAGVAGRIRGVRLRRHSGRRRRGAGGGRRCAPRPPAGLSAADVELLAEGRTAEVFAYGEGRVLKLDRPDWNGLSAFEATVLARLAEAGLPVARAARHGHRRRPQRRRPGPGRGAVAARGGGRLGARGDRSSRRLTSSRCSCAATGRRSRWPARPGAASARARSRRASPTPRCGRSWWRCSARSTTAGAASATSTSTPSNVLVGPDGWVVIDWLTVAAGPSAADLARTLVLWGQRSTGPVGRFLRAVRREGQARRGPRRRCPRRVGARRRRGPGRRGIRGRGAGVAAAGGGAAPSGCSPDPGGRLRRRGSRARRCRAGPARRAPWPGSRARPGRRRRAA